MTHSTQVTSHMLHQPRKTSFPKIVFCLLQLQYAASSMSLISSLSHSFRQILTLLVYISVRTQFMCCNKWPSSGVGNDSGKHSMRVSCMCAH